MRIQIDPLARPIDPRRYIPRGMEGMEIDLKSKDLDAELNKLVSFYESGAGYGSPEGELEHQRKFQLLMHRQNLRVKQFNSKLTLANIVLTVVNISIIVYQVFFKI
jgi:hypothetical protein